MRHSKLCYFAKLRYFALGTLLMALPAVAAAPAFAIENTQSGGAASAKPAPKQQTPANPPGKVKPAMSTNECNGLGGTVAREGTCMSAFTCITSDKDGVLHQTCIDEPNR